MAEKMQNVEQEPSKSVPTSALDDLLNERDRAKKEPTDTKSEEKIEHDSKKSKDDKEPIVKLKEEAVQTKPENNDKKIDNENGEDEDNIKPSELDNLKKELEKTKTALTENQKWGRANSQKLKNAIKQFKSLIDEGSLTEDEAKPFLQLLESDANEQEEEQKNVELTPAQKILNIANQELENIRRYTDDELLDKKVRAFDFFLNTATKADVQGALGELEDLQENPVKLAKKMLAIGQQYYDEVYKEFEESGGFKNFFEKKNSEIQKLQKKIDKLEGKLSQYDYKPNYRIDELSDSDKLKEGKPKGALDEALEDRDRVVRR